MDSPIFDVLTDADPTTISEVALAIFRDWVAFALGQTSLGGRILVHPTGRYASSISMKKFDSREGFSHVAIIADEGIAPEALFLETGHKAIDLKKLQAPGPRNLGRAGGAIARVLPTIAQPRAFKPSLYANARVPTGWRTLSKNSPPGSWIIPPMPAYMPGRHLAEMAAKALGEAGFQAGVN